MSLQSINPATGTIIETFEEYSISEVNAILEQVSGTGRPWRSVPFQERAARMRAAEEELLRNAQQYARGMTDEMGKPVSQSIAEVEKCAWVCRYYADNAERMLAEEFVETDAANSYVRFDPLGVVLAIMPWNFPFWQVFRFAAPALMAGNTAVLKHASNVSRCALMIEEVFRKAGFPAHAFRTVLVGSSRIGDIIADDRIAAVTLTGSELAGSMVAASAGKHLKKTVMELGGSDPFLVLAGADSEKAARVAATARCINTGQSCIAAKRFVVEDSIADVFEAAFVDAMASKRTGDPLDPSTEIGPMAREDLLVDLHRQVQQSIAAGATRLLGGNRRAGAGSYYEPTVLGNVHPGMPVYDEEVFGPVAAVIRVADSEEAVRIANDTPYGLGASVWTRDINLAEQIAGEIEAGSVFINGLVKSDPRLPFGGVKRSGYGRELAYYGIREFVNIKSVWIG